MAVVLVTAPALEPVSRTEAKLHCRIDADMVDDDTLVDALVKAAREWVEQRTRRALITQTWDLWQDDWPVGDEFRLPQPPLQSVTHVKYVDEDAATTTWSSANYLVDTFSEPGRVVMKGSASWPSATLQDVNAVNVRFVAGYGSAGTAVPQPIRQAMLMLIGHWYENREAILATGAMPKEVPLAVDALLWPYRVLRFP